MKTESYVMVPFDSISLRTKFKEKKKKKKKIMKITLNQKSHCTKHKMMKTENKNDKRKNSTLSAIPTSHSENSRFSLCPDSYFAQE